MRGVAAFIWARQRQCPIEPDAPSRSSIACALVTKNTPASTSLDEDQSRASKSDAKSQRLRFILDMDDIELRFIFDMDDTEIKLAEIKLAESRFADKADATAASDHDVRALSNKDVADLVRRILVERSIGRDLTEHADLREVGLTSFDMVDLVLSVESAFDLQIPETQITPANFRSIAAIDALLSRLRAQH